MSKTMKYGRLEAIEFKFELREIVKILRDAGEIPEGFEIDREAENYTKWPIQINVKRITALSEEDEHGS